MRSIVLTGAVVASLVCSTGAALAQKTGGVLKMYHRDNPPSLSIHEEATNSTVIPIMSVMNNLVLFDQSKTTMLWSPGTFRRASLVSTIVFASRSIRA